MVKSETKNDLFLGRANCDETPIVEMGAPIKNYSVFIEPQKDENALKVGDLCAKEIGGNFIADFEKNNAYCKIYGGKTDLMCHVSTFYRIGGKIYVSYYANTSSEHEDPAYQTARLAYCSESNTEDVKIIDVSKVGDIIGGKTTVMIYDTIMAYDGGEVIFLLWAASLDGEYYRLYRTFDLKNETLGEIGVNRLSIGGVLTDFSISGIKSGFAANRIPIKETFSDIGIMQKFSTETESRTKYYYTGAYSGFLNFIIRSKDFITWEYVAKPDFVNFSEWENATYILSGKIYYFVRQIECRQGFLTVYDIKRGKWETPVLISDCQSRADFFYYCGRLYLVNAPESRECIAITRIDTDDISKSSPMLFCNLKSSIFYPFTRVCGDELYISYTVNRKHIRLTKINLKNYL